MAQARELTGDNYYVVSVIGDGALTGGMAYEAMNNASRMKTNFIIVLNDNQMSISENVGGMNQYLNSFRTSDAYLDLKDGVTNSLNRIPVVGERMVKRIRNAKSGIKQLFVPGMFFENMGITYLGPVDGTNIKEIRKVLAEAKRVRGPVLVHVRTIKGEGYLPAERHPARFHGTGPFDIDTGVPLYHQEKAHYTDVFSTVMRKMGEREPKVVAITAAMADGTGLKRFKNLFPERFFDVGIAEEHAVTFAAGMAKAGLKPVFAVYSSFLQRAYDQVLHDVCAQNLAVVFAVDRAGLVGKDGATHQGIFDLSYLSSIPNLTVMAPKKQMGAFRYAQVCDCCRGNGGDPLSARRSLRSLERSAGTDSKRLCGSTRRGYRGCTFCDRFDGGNRLAGKKKTGRKRNHDNGGKCKICHATG